MRSLTEANGYFPVVSNWMVSGHHGLALIGEGVLHEDYVMIYCVSEWINMMTWGQESMGERGVREDTGQEQGHHSN